MDLVDYDLVPAELIALCERLRAAGHEAYLVGGGVRDLLLGRPVADWDVTTSARPERVQALFRRTIATGIAHGTVTVLTPSRLPVEVTTFRGEGAYSDGRRPDRVEFVGDLDSDLARRDFTINAIALDPLKREILDPLAGRADLRARLVRAVGDPFARFDEDGLRSLRAIRFAATLEFALDAETRAAIPRALTTFRRVAAERVRDELLKLLAARRPSAGVRLLRETLLLGEILPELDQCAGRAIGEIPDLFEHALRSCDAAPREPLLRLAALLHQVGWLDVDPASPAGEQQHAALGAHRCAAIAQRLRLSNQERDLLVGWIAGHVLDETLADGPALRRFIRQVGSGVLPGLFSLRQADLSAGLHGGDRARALERRLEALEQLRVRVEAELARSPALEVRDLNVSGTDLMARLKRPAGPWLGVLLRELLEAVIERPELNERESLLALAEARDRSRTGAPPGPPPRG